MSTRTRFSGRYDRHQSVLESIYENREKSVRNILPSVNNFDILSHMQHLESHQYDPNMYYHRNTSPVYRKYLETCGLITYDISQGNP